MKLWQIVNQIYGAYGQRFQIPATRILRLVSMTQRIAFNRDCRAFEKRARLAPIVGEETAYRFPADCRRIKAVLNVSDIWIDDFTREITVLSPVSSNLEVAYYRQPEELTCKGDAGMDGIFKDGTSTEKAGLFTETDEAKVIVPDEWRWQVLVQLAAALCDTENYGDKTPQSIAEQYLAEFWEDMDKRPNDRKVITSVGAW